MRTLFLSLSLCFALAGLVQCQSRQGEPQFYVEVDTNQVLLGNPFVITFTAENSGDETFVAPDWGGVGLVPAGSAEASSFSMQGGKTKSSHTWTFYITSTSTGEVTVPPATLRVGGKEYKTAPLTLRTLPNPDGAVVKPRAKVRRFEFDSDDPDTPPAPPAVPEEPAKPKRKTVRI